MAKIASIRALEILDLRGNPTVRVHLTLDDGTKVSSSVPSGASTGEHEAAELRDDDKSRFGGKGVLKAVANVNDLIGPALVDHDPTRQIEIDALLLALDGTPNKAKLWSERNSRRINGGGASSSTGLSASPVSAYTLEGSASISVQAGPCLHCMSIDGIKRDENISVLGARAESNRHRHRVGRSGLDRLGR